MGKCTEAHPPDKHYFTKPSKDVLIDSFAFGLGECSCFALSLAFFLASSFDDAEIK